MFVGLMRTPEATYTSPGPNNAACHGYAPYGAWPAPGVGLPATGG